MDSIKLIAGLLISTGLLSVDSHCPIKNRGEPENLSKTDTGITVWITKGDQSALLQKQTTMLAFTSGLNSYPTIAVDSNLSYQTVDGFGFALTGGSAYLVNRLPAEKKSSLLQELFGHDENSIGISYLRVSIGASDLNAEVFSYDDLPGGQTDPGLAHFSLSKDTVDVIPLLKEILLVNPHIKIMGSPWSPPVWMKTNGKSIGGSLQPKYYSVYAQYFVKYIQAMKAKGINVDAITVQNEPQHGGNNPSMLMSATEQADFIRNHLGPAFRAAGIKTKIIIWDHNCDNPGYPLAVLGDTLARQYIDGSAFHLYSGDISALSAVHHAYPDKNLYFTEQWTGAKTSFDGDLKWHVKNVIIGSMQNWSRVALEWNLASDAAYKPHTPGGCTECKGAITLDGVIKRNVAYYIIAHASRFVPPGSVRTGSNDAGRIFNVAFKTPAGNIVLIAVNDGNTETIFNIKFKDQWATTSLPAGAVATYQWQ